MCHPFAILNSPYHIRGLDIGSERLNSNLNEPLKDIELALNKGSVIIDLSAHLRQQQNREGRELHKRLRATVSKKIGSKAV